MVDDTMGPNLVKIEFNGLHFMKRLEVELELFRRA